MTLLCANHASPENLIIGLPTVSGLIAIAYCLLKNNFQGNPVQSQLRISLQITSPFEKGRSRIYLKNLPHPSISKRGVETFIIVC